MGKFTKYESTTSKKERPWKIHPIWRGIGCILILIIPVLSYAGSVLLVQANMKNGWVPVPRKMYSQLLGLPISLAEILVLILLIFIGFGVFVIFYSSVYKFMGPPKYGPHDAPPIRARKGTRKAKSR